MKWFRSLLFAALLAFIAPFAHAAISVVQVATPVESFGSGTSHTITLTSTPTVGNYIILELGFRSVQTGFAISSVTDNQTGNTYSAVTSGTGTAGQAGAAIYIAKVNAASGTFTVTVATGTQTPNYMMYAMEVSGISGATDQATTAVQTANVTSFSVTQAGANTNASDLVVTALMGGKYSTGVSMGTSDPPSSGYTSMGVESGTGIYGGAADAGYKIISSIETDAASWTTTTATNAVSVIASFPAASGGSGGGGGSSGTGAIAYFPGTFVSQWATLTSNTTLSYVEPQVLCDAHLGAFTITLPTAVNSFTTYHVKKVDSTPNTCTVATTNSQTIDGATTKSLSSQYSSLTVVSDNANWWAQ